MEIRAELVFEGTRKALVNDIANAYGVKAQYLGAPTFAYKVAHLTFTRDNKIEWSLEEMTKENIRPLGDLARAGRFDYGKFWINGKDGIEAWDLVEPAAIPATTHPEAFPPVEEPATEEFETLHDWERAGGAYDYLEEVYEIPAETAPVGPTSEETEPAGITAPEAGTAPTEARFTVNLANDLTDAQYQNLRNLIEQKENLLDLAFPGTLKLIQRTPDGRLEFKGWFPYDNNGEAYLLFAARMVDMAKAAKRISTKQNPVVNPKYQFRCFLLRLGFIGKEYGPMRKALMQNLTGNSAWLRGSKDA